MVRIRWWCFLTNTAKCVHTRTDSTYARRSCNFTRPRISDIVIHQIEFIAPDYYMKTLTFVIKNGISFGRKPLSTVQGLISIPSKLKFIDRNRHAQHIILSMIDGDGKSLLLFTPSKSIRFHSVAMLWAVNVSERRFGDNRKIKILFRHIHC